jgi:hypothetical protein
MLYGIYFAFLPRQLLGYELEEKQYKIFPPGPVFFRVGIKKPTQKNPPKKTQKNTPKITH